MHPVEAFLNDLIHEIALVSAQLKSKPKIARLHLGGGTPTLLSGEQMARLLEAIDQHFTRTSDCEFSVKIDPTEAADDVLDILAERGMTRASIGVQDFAPKVQVAIGRVQSFQQTQAVVDRLRAGGVESLNVDLLYGLPFQTLETLLTTLDQVHSLSPDRMALYGYAHVPHMSKRQRLIATDSLPNTLQRFEAAQLAKHRLQDLGYLPVGIDHFSLETDSLAAAAQLGTLRRNFQGYTDDPCATLIGFGASAISRYRQGFVQNAVATAAYQMHIREGRLSGHKGYVLTPEDAFIADALDQLMCQGSINGKTLAVSHPAYADTVQQIFQDLQFTFPRALERSDETMNLKSGMEQLARVVAAHIDTALQAEHVHRVAI